jgi:soluble lytic murein transglycosylase
MADRRFSRYPRIMPFRFRVAVLALAFATSLPSCAYPSDAADDPLRHPREVFKRAYDQAQAVGDPQTPDEEGLRTYPLYPYLQAARIRRALASAGHELTSVDQRAETFLAYYDREPVGRALRRDWLANLAFRGLWETYLLQYRDDLADDVLRCHSFTARIALGQVAELVGPIQQQWLTPASLPECTPAFDWLRSQNQLTPAAIDARARLALEQGNTQFAKQLAAMLPAEQAAPLLRWSALLENPQREIDAVIRNRTRLESKVALAGWTKFVRVDRDGGIKKFDSFMHSQKIAALEVSPYALSLALALAWDRRPEALDYFKRVRPEDLDDSAKEWQARAAIWNDQWKLAADAITSMSDTSRKLARWRYWAARAAERKGDAALAQQLFESVLLDDNFYSIMAAARLGRPVAPHPEKIVVDDVHLASLNALPALVRARELFWCGMRDEASSEWSVGFRQLDDLAKKQSINLAARWGWYEQAIVIAAQLRVFNDYALLYPQPYNAPVQAAAQLSGLPVDLIYSVLRQESLYRSDAVSKVGARGLLQLMPDTARRTARAYNQARPEPDDLFDPDINIRLGAAQLKTMVDRFGGQTVVALAGYNAGPNAAARWLPARTVESDVWIENIPYNETRNYVQRILWHSIVFGWLRTGEPQAVDPKLARVTPLVDASLLGQR